MAEDRVKIHVMVFFDEEPTVLKCDQHLTIADVRNQWLDAIGRAISVAFFTQDERHLPDDLTIGAALAHPTARSLELHAFRKSSYWLQAFGFDEARAQFEVADVLTPAAVRREIGAALDIFTDDFRLIWNGAELDQELPFREQGFTQGAQLTVDPRVIVKVNFDGSDETRTVECFGSECIGDLRQKLALNDDTAFVTTSPYRHILADPLRVCYIVSDIMDLQIPIELTAERKVMLAFEPITLEHLRQQLPVALSCTPINLYDLVSARFELTTEHRLAINGQELDNSEPLRNQMTDTNDIIQVDILRPCEVFDLWEDPWDVNSYEEVYLYSTESAHALYQRDELNDQRLYYENIKLTIFGAMIDVFGAISGQCKPVLVVDRDVERSFPILTFDGIAQSLGWARSILLDVVPTSGGFLPNEIMRSGRLLPAKSTLSELRLTEDTLMITDPEKVLVSSEKKLRVCRFAHNSTFGDVRAQMQQLKGSLDVGLKTRDSRIPDEAMNRKLDREIFLLSNASRFQTQLTVTMNGRCFGCRFEPQQVSFTDVMINVGKQAKVMPRHLFKRSLYCCGCGRRLSKEEEPHQAIPATCCSVRSLQLTDRRVRDVGIQAGNPRTCNKQTYTLDCESRDACVGTECANNRVVVSATHELRSIVTAHPPPPSTSLHIGVYYPEGDQEQSTVTVKGSHCRALLAAADRQLLRVSPENSPVVFCEEVIYDRNGEERRALQCFDEKAERYLYIDLEDGGITEHGSWLHFSLRFLRPSSPLPSSPSLPPAIFIRTEAEFFISTPQRQLQSAPASALTDPSSVALLLGVRSGAQLFWELPAFTYVDAQWGRVYSLKEIPGGPKRFVFALLRDKDLIPRIKVPESKVLIVYRKGNLEPRVEGGRVCCTGFLRKYDVERWDIPHKSDSFQRAFTAAARMK